jgi:putative transposase
LANAPGDYRWSSFHHNARGAQDDVVTPHATYLSLGKSDSARQSAYRDLFRRAIDDDIDAIRQHVTQGKALGSETFRDRIEAALNRRVRLAQLGRPRKKYSDPIS